MTEVIRSRRATLPKARSVLWNPSPQELKELTARMPNARRTVYDNLNVQTKVVSRSKASTYVVTDHPENHSDQTITRAEGERIARVQDEYIASRDMLVIDGYIGNDPQHRVAARLFIEASNANIAGMQQALYFDNEGAGGPDWEPELMVVYTPNLACPGYPDDRVIAVDLDHGITRVLNSDYFGESKKGGLRMWNKVVQDRGGL
ncbi:MAG TPA: phosphoenolpyruvate carboxykinase (ATP), partial [Candidatus Dormibacteraeota bacterium]|nr:phosphoenolpyruvate carboxykinase (ATP) [Candidatus Dormibacteraeota bacterium]